jgi:hypothetical protein
MYTEKLRGKNGEIPSIYGLVPENLPSASAKVCVPADIEN